MPPGRHARIASRSEPPRSLSERVACLTRSAACSTPCGSAASRPTASMTALLPRLRAHGREAWELDFLNLSTGERIPVSWDAFRIDDPDTGEPLAMATITRDLRDRRRAQQEIEAYRRRIDTVFASISDAFYALDRDFRFFSYLNDRAVQ